MLLTRNSGCKGRNILLDDKGFHEYFFGYRSKMASMAHIPMQKG